MNKYVTLILLSAGLLALSACRKENIVTPEIVTPPDPQPPTEPTIDYSKASLGELAAMQGIRLGAAFTYWEYLQNPQVAEILTREFNAVTFGNEMKHDAIVQADGSMNFGTADLDLKTKDETAQAEMFRLIFQKYLEIVPEAQRGGITFWGINDKDSWVGEQNAPLLWKGADYRKKKAYETLYLYLCELNGINPYTE